MSDKYGQDIIDSDGDDILEGTWEWQGREPTVEVRNISYDDQVLVQRYGSLMAELAHIQERLENGEDVSERERRHIEDQIERLDDFSWEDEDDQNDFIKEIVDHVIVKPEIDTSDTSLDKVVAVVEGAVSTLQESNSVRDAKGDMPVDTPN